MRSRTAIDRPELKYPPFVPAQPLALQNAEDEDMFASIRRQDVLLHHPFDSFQPVVDFLRKAAHDPNVLAIKMTLYRVGRNSPIVEALLEAHGGRQAGRRSRGTEGAIRRGKQYRMGARPGTRRRSCCLRLARTEDSLQGVHGGAPGSRYDPSLRSPLDRQLQRDYGSHRTPISACSRPTSRLPPTRPTCSTT